MKTLTDFAPIIKKVFESMKVLFDECASSGDWNNEASECLIAIGDEETLQEILLAADL